MKDFTRGLTVSKINLDEMRNSLKEVCQTLEGQPQVVDFRAEFDVELFASEKRQQHEGALRLLKGVITILDYVLYESDEAITILSKKLPNDVDLNDGLEELKVLSRVPPGDHCPDLQKCVLPDGPNFLIKWPGKPLARISQAELRKFTDLAWGICVAGYRVDASVVESILGCRHGAQCPFSGAFAKSPSAA
jgi:hypothetical protein